jgi:hypothetical protein
MSANHELLREAADLLRQLGVKVPNTGELRKLLRDMPGGADPEVETARAVRTIGVTVTSVTLGVTGLMTLAMTMSFAARPSADWPLFPALLGIIWGCALLIVGGTLGAGFVTLMMRRRATAPPRETARRDGSTASPHPTVKEVPPVLPEALPTEPASIPERAFPFPSPVRRP